ncbi:MAG: pyruvate formate lyase family protein, partial [Holophaga sp.]|nr:pyruvate formate lyase family protein [Holophaga sp.]
MNERTTKLRQESLDAIPSLSAERAELITAFYRQNAGKFSVPVMRAKAFQHLCEHKTLWLGEGELIVGERGPRPKAVPTYPELTCHSEEDLRILDSRPMTSYKVDAAMIKGYAAEIIPYWDGRSLRDQIFQELPQEWKDAYGAGVFTEFMEQRAPGHTVLDDKIYTRGLKDFLGDIARSEAALDFELDSEALDKREQLKAMAIACKALIRFAERHADLAQGLALVESDSNRQSELRNIAEVCRRVPAEAPRDFQEAL